MQRAVKEQLKRGLSTLPAPRNDYEIVVPDDAMETDASVPGEGDEAGSYAKIEDQADIDARIESERKKQRIVLAQLRNLSIILSLIAFPFVCICLQASWN